MLKQKFDLDKAIEVLIYITQRVNNTYNALKVLYFADKEHLSKFGRLICNDDYVAMEHGPVPSHFYDIVKQARGDSLFEINTEEVLHKLFETKGFLIKPTREPDIRYLSISDRECLDEAISKYGHLSFGKLRELSHDQAFESADYNDKIPLDAIIKILPNADELLECYESTESD